MRKTSPLFLQTGVIFYTGSIKSTIFDYKSVFSSATILLKQVFIIFQQPETFSVLFLFVFVFNNLLYCC